VTTIATAGADSAARQDLLERYARLAIRVGINPEPGREVAIRAMIEHARLWSALRHVQAGGVGLGAERRLPHVGASHRPAADRLRP
jgi:hypothetical protein